MAKPKRPKDLNLLASRLVAEATGQVEPEDTGKNPAAVQLGRLGGLKGGKARAKALSKKKRATIAKFVRADVMMNAGAIAKLIESREEMLIMQQAAY